MTGNIAFDVVIGLVFIYAIYSLLTTIIVEFVAVNLQLRARNLRHAINRMLTDENQKELAKNENIKDLAQKFYETPLIKYLASGRFKLLGGNKYPSYLQPRNFADAILYVLKFDSEMQSSVKEKINNSLGKYQNTETGKFLLSMLEDSDFTISKFRKRLEQWFNDTMERTTGWYKKNITYLTLLVGFIVAMLFNADTFLMVNQLSKDPDVREQFVQLAGKLIENKAYTSRVFDETLRERLLGNNDLKSKWRTDSLGFIHFVSDSVYKASEIAQDSLFKRFDAVYAQSDKARKILNFEHKKSNWYIFDNWMNFFGCLVTAIALSLGAPFWFDMLNNLMRLRSSIPILKKKPEVEK